MLRKVVERNDGPLRDEEMVRLFRELMSACLAQEEPLKVAYLGPEGTFTQSAVFKHFGHSVHALAVPTIDEVFHEVESGTADFGVAPIENSSEGTVNIHTLDMFLTSPLKICGEIELRIHQNLMGRMQDIERHQARLLASAVARAMPRLACASTCRTSRRFPSRATPKRRAVRATRRAPQPGRRGRREGLRPADIVQHGRGPRRQHHALRRRRPQAVSGERQGQDLDPRVGRRHRGPGSPPALAGAACRAMAST